MKTILIYVDHGLTLGYYLYTGLAEKLTAKGVRLVFLVQDELIDQMRKEFSSNDLLIFESSRERETQRFQSTHHPTLFEFMDYLRASSMSPQVKLTYVDTHRRRVEFGATGRRKAIFRFLRPLIWVLRSSKAARKAFRWEQDRLFKTELFGEVFDRYKPDLVISSTAGWRMDRYFLREAHRRKIPSAMTVIGWDNPSAFGLPGADVDYANVWSDIHRHELRDGLDWPDDKIHVGGMPLYDGYISKTWEMPREEYFALHGLDPNKKLIAYAATALSISPNLHIVEALMKIIAGNQLSTPSQLLIRLHPNHFKSQAYYQEEREKIYEITKNQPDIHVVAPKALSGGLPRYSGEDFPEKASMLAHCDVMVTIYSTMVVEAALQDKPVISVCIDSPTGWGNGFWVPLHEVPSWPTASRVEKAGATLSAFTEDELVADLNAYLQHPELHRENRSAFVKQELTFLHGEATAESANYLLKLLGIQP